jgi:uroporphyrinogen decarboxylase
MRNDLFLKSLKGEKIERFPVWLMRQAGRYMPQYREIRRKTASFLELCQNPFLSAQITLLPEKLLNIDALILFSDILIPLLGIDAEISYEGGIKINYPYKTIVPFQEKKIEFVYETIRLVKNLSQKPLIGFAGGPYTLLAYLLEGKTSKEFSEIRKLYYRDKERFFYLLNEISKITFKYLLGQIKAGVDAIQIFDSWTYLISPEIYKEYLPYLKQLIVDLKKEAPEIPIIYFFRGSGFLYELVKELPIEAFSFDWTIDIKKPLKEIKNKAIQGNLDPLLLYAEKNTIEKKVINFLEEIKKYRKTLYIFNLGHGLKPDMDLEKVKFLIQIVQDFRLQ